MNLVCPVDVDKQPGGSLPDIQSADCAIEILENITQPGQPAEEPFFLAVGFHKPHIPLKVSAKDGPFVRVCVYVCVCVKSLTEGKREISGEGR